MNMLFPALDPIAKPHGHTAWAWHYNCLFRSFVVVAVFPDPYPYLNSYLRKRGALTTTHNFKKSATVKRFSVSCMRDFFSSKISKHTFLIQPYIFSISLALWPGRVMVLMCVCVSLCVLVCPPTSSLKVNHESKVYHNLRVNDNSKVNHKSKVNHDSKANYNLKINHKSKVNPNSKVNHDSKINFNSKVNHNSKVTHNLKLTYSSKVTHDSKVNGI